MDDYAKDGGPGRSDFYVVFTMSLCALELKQLLALGVHALRSYLKLICEYELHSLPNEKLVAQRITVKITSRSNYP